jgi:hypothetical protein
VACDPSIQFRSSCFHLLYRTQAQAVSFIARQPRPYAIRQGTFPSATHTATKETFHQWRAPNTSNLPCTASRLWADCVHRFRIRAFSGLPDRTAFPRTYSVLGWFRPPLERHPRGEHRGLTGRGFADHQCWLAPGWVTADHNCGSARRRRREVLLYRITWHWIHQAARSRHSPSR